MTDAPPTLEQRISACARESGLRIGAGTGSDAFQGLREALAGDPALADLARQMIEAKLEQRDHISKWQNGLLRWALEG